MKAAIIAGCVVLSVLSASAAHAEDSKWAANWHSCQIVKTDALRKNAAGGLYGDNLQILNEESGVVFLSLEDVLAIQKELPTLKKCSAFYNCVYKRDYHKHYATAGTSDPVKPGEKRPKHCYEKRR